MAFDGTLLWWPFIIGAAWLDRTPVRPVGKRPTLLSLSSQLPEVDVSEEEETSSPPLEAAAVFVKPSELARQRESLHEKQAGTPELEDR